MAEEYKIKPYKSIEEKLIVDTGIRDFFINYWDYKIRGTFGAGTAFLRIPTIIRRLGKKQTFYQRISRKEQEKSEFFGKIVGGAIGVAGGVCFSVGALYSTIETARDGNYIPLIILGAANVASGTFELGRLSKNKKERLEVKTGIRS